MFTTIPESIECKGRQKKIRMNGKDIILRCVVMADLFQYEYKSVRFRYKKKTKRNSHFKFTIFVFFG